MQRRTLRVLVLVAAAATLVGTGTPPATAGDGGVYLMQGTAIVDGGAGYPCTPLGTTACTTAAVPNVNPACLTTGLKKCGVVDWNNGSAPMRTGTFQGSICVGAEVNAGIKHPGKAKDAIATGTCFMSASFNLLGWCGLSHGMGTGLITFTSAVTGSTNVTLFDFLWQEATPMKWVLTFQWWKGGWTKPANPNKGFGIYLANADPTVSSPIGTQSCTNGTMTNFNLMGPFVFLPVKNL